MLIWGYMHSLSSNIPMKFTNTPQSRTARLSCLPILPIVDMCQLESPVVCCPWLEEPFQDVTLLCWQSWQVLLTPLSHTPRQHRWSSVDYVNGAWAWNCLDVVAIGPHFLSSLRHADLSSPPVSAFILCLKGTRVTTTGDGFPLYSPLVVTRAGASEIVSGWHFSPLCDKKQKQKHTSLRI